MTAQLPRHCEPLGEAIQARQALFPALDCDAAKGAVRNDGRRGPLATLFSRLRRDRRGVAAVEMALAVSIVVLPICACLIVAGQALETQYRLTRAMHAGFLYAWSNPTATSTQIQAAVTAANNGVAPDTFGASNLCFCIPPNGTIAQSNGSFTCDTQTCTNGTVLSTWVSIVVAQNITPLFPFPYLPTSVASGGTARIK